jgi:hypothetical protein
VPLESVRRVAVPGFVVLRRGGTGLLEGAEKYWNSQTGSQRLQERQAGVYCDQPGFDNGNPGSTYGF